jgi:hypothetical protein
MKTLLQTGRTPGIIQNCWAVPDIDAAMQNWIDIGYGPFLTLKIEMPNAIYRGSVVPLTVSVGLADGGDVQIELVQQLSGGPSLYREYCGYSGGGLHHVCRMSRNCEDEIAAFQKRGIALAGQGSFGGVEFYYLDTRSTLGCMLELVPDAAPVHALYTAVANAARNWDGSDPIRPLKM